MISNDNETMKSYETLVETKVLRCLLNVAVIVICCNALEEYSTQRVMQRKSRVHEFDARPWSLIYAGAGGAKTGTGSQFCCGSNFVNKVRRCCLVCISSTSRQSL